MKGKPPAPDPADDYGLHACALMRKMGKMGVKEAIQHEIANPSWDDSDWCRMVVGLAANKL